VEKQAKWKEFRAYLTIFTSVGLCWISGFLLILIPAEAGVARLVFLVIFSIAVPSQGFLIFILYCINPRVIAKWCGLLGRCIPFFKRWEDIDKRKTISSSPSS
jgi:hypothetical protein